MKNPNLNVELLLEVKKQILAEPKQFVMADVFATYNSLDSYVVPNCGTAACIAGWTLSLHWKINPAEAMRKYKSNPMHDWIEISCAILHISEDDACDLFYAAYWPDKYRKRYDSALTAKGKAQVAADRIDAFIEERS